MRYPSVSLLILNAFIILSGIPPMLGGTCAYAGNETTEDQVAHILFEESAQGKIKVVIFDFEAASVNADRALTENELKSFGKRYTEEFTANLMTIIKDYGKRDRIAVIDRSRLDDVLRENNLPSGSIAGRSVTEIGRMAGIDVIISGRIQVTGNSTVAMVKVVRAKDGEILSMVKQGKQEKPSSVASMPVTLIDTVEKIKIGSYKALFLNLASGGTLDVAIDVVHGNPIDVNVLPAAEFENYKGQKKSKAVSDFTAAKMKNYKRTAYLGKGDYYLVIRDSSLGLFSVQSGEIKITVRLEPLTYE